MKATFLQVTYRNGRPVAGYLSLPRRPGDRSAHSKRAEAGLVIDFAPGGRAIGVEITAPAKVTVGAVNRVLKALGFSPVKRKDLAPVLAA
jgi:hypothetical protein